jgi:hypothetical protein
VPPFPATVSAEGRLIQGGPSLRERARGRAGEREYGVYFL